MNHCRSTLQSRLCVAGFAALSCLMGPAFAAPPAATEVQITELPDGSLVTSVPGQGVVVHGHYTHQTKLVASNCLSLQTHRVGFRGFEPELVNNCGYATSVSYCIDNPDADIRTCDNVGHRKIESYRIEPRSTVAIRTDATVPDTYVDWVACRSDATLTSTLIANGTRGECLGKDGDAQVASIQSMGMP